jgi:hypothetical protein
MASDPGEVQEAAEVPKPTSDVAKPRPWGTARRAGRRAWDWLGRVSGDRIQRPYAKTILAHQLSRDAEENLELTPPADSHLAVEGIWAFEAFTPSNIEGALKQMRKKGWAQQHRRGAERSLVAWLSSVRKEGGRGSHNVWFNRPADGRYSTVSHHADLPEFAASAVGEMVALTPSISGLAVFFVVKPQVRGEIEAALRANYVSQVRSQGDFFTAIDPRAARLEAINTLRRRWRTQIVAWFAAHAPGVFCEGDAVGLPTCELLIGDNFPLFERGDEAMSKISEVAGAVFSHWIFEQEDTEDAVMFAPHPVHMEDLGTHAILTASRRCLESSVHRLNKGAGDDRFILGADEEFRESFTRWALLEVVNVYAQRVNQARDQAALLFSSPFPLRVLKRLQRLTTILGDTAILTRELQTFAEQDMRARRSGYDLVVRRFRPKETRWILQDWIQENLKGRIEALASASGELDTFIAAQGNLTNARANLELQVIVFVFAIIGLMFGAVSGFEAGYNLWKDHKEAAVKKATASDPPTT